MVTMEANPLSARPDASKFVYGANAGSAPAYPFGKPIRGSLTPAVPT